MNAHADVLLVEDNEINQLVARQILKKAGYSCEVSSSGEDALRRLEQETYRLILMDVQMPGMDGIETTRRIRSFSDDQPNAHIPIIAMTAYTTSEDRSNCSSAGMNDYITKPLNLDGFVATVKRYLEHDSQAGSQPSADDASTPHADARVFDLNDALSRTRNDRQLVGRAVRMFLDSADERIHSLSAASAHGEYHQVADLAHNLQGAALNVSAVQVAAIATDIEHEARDHNPKALRSSVKRLESALTQFRDVVAAHELSQD